MYDVESTRREQAEGQSGTLKIFADDVSLSAATQRPRTEYKVVLSPDTPQGWVLRGLVLDIVHIFEVNRREASRVLLALPRFLAPTFKSPSQTAANPDDSPASTLSLESLIISTLLQTLMTLPTPPFEPIYYGSIITELCKTSPNAVAPPVGRAVRRIFSMLGAEGLDAELSRRISEWFAVHLSNFGFQWMWKEWCVMADLCAGRHVADRQGARAGTASCSSSTSIHAPASRPRSASGVSRPHHANSSACPHRKDADVISVDPAEPTYPYENPDHPLHAEASELLDMLRKRATSSEIITHVSTDGEPSRRRNILCFRLYFTWAHAHSPTF